MTKKNKILFAVGGLVLIALIGSVSFFVGRQTGSSLVPTPTPSPIVTPMQEEATPEETGSPEPTASPTLRPRPTATSAPQPSATPTPTPGVVNIETSVDPTTSDACSKQFTFTSKIYTNAPLTVEYKWLRSDGATASPETLTFTEAGFKTVTSTWTLSRSSGEHYDGWKRIEIISPQSALGNKADFTLSCP